MSALQQLKSYFQTSPRGLNFAQVEALLDLFPKAALLVDRATQQVTLANARATELTAHTRSELSAKSLTDLLPEFDTAGNLPLAEGLRSPFPGVLLIHGGNQIEVLIHCADLDAASGWTLVTIDPITPSAKVNAASPSLDQWEALDRLTASIQNLDLDSALHQALRAGKTLTKADCLAIYRLMPQEPRIALAALEGTPDLLPTSIPSSDIGRLRKEILWTPGQRPRSEIHRAARKAGLRYLLSLPLGEVRAIHGILVIGDRKHTPSPILLPLARTIAHTTGASLQVTILVSNLKSELYNQRLELAVNETIKEGVEDGTITLDKDLKIQELNTAAELILGYATQEVRGQPVQNILIGTNILTPALQAAQNGIATHNLGNIRLHRRDGQSFQAFARTLPVMVEGRVDRILIVIQDLSEHEQFRIRTQQLEQRALLGELTAIFAHEVSNPINNISTGLQVLAMKTAEDDPLREVVTRMQQDCQRLEHQMKSVLDFSRTAQYNMEPIDLKGFLERLVNRWRPQMARLNVKHLLHVEPDTPVVLADRRALEQVFTNLITNAIRAMSEGGGTLAFQVYRSQSAGERQRVNINISDTGAGIPEEIRERIFQPFFTTNPDGTGLGLAITKRIITAHKGTIQIVDSFPGGTVFQIQLPAAEEDD